MPKSNIKVLPLNRTSRHILEIWYVRDLTFRALHSASGNKLAA